MMNHMFVAHKRQEQNHQQQLCGRKGGRRRGAKNKRIPNINPLRGGGGLVRAQVHPMQERKDRVTEETCKDGHEMCPSLVKEEDSEVPEEQVLMRLVQQRLLQEKLVKQSLESDVSEKTETSGNMTEMSNVVTREPKEVKIGDIEEPKEGRNAKETVEEKNMTKICDVVTREPKEGKEEDSKVPEVLAAEDIVLAAEDQALATEVQQVVAAADIVLAAEDQALATEVQQVVAAEDQILVAEDQALATEVQQLVAAEDQDDLAAEDQALATEVQQVVAAEDQILAAEDQALATEVQQVVAAEDQILVAEDQVLATEVQQVVAAEDQQILVAEYQLVMVEDYHEQVLAQGENHGCHAAQDLAQEEVPGLQAVQVLNQEENLGHQAAQDLAREEDPGLQASDATEAVIGVADVERVIGTAELDENAASEPVMVLDEAEQTAVEDIPALNTFQSEEVKAVEDVEGQHCDTQVATVKPEETT
jgi:hypothetical protein